MAPKIVMTRITVEILYDPESDGEADAVVDTFPNNLGWANGIAEWLDNRSEDWQADRFLTVRVTSETDSDAIATYRRKKGDE